MSLSSKPIIAPPSKIEPSSATPAIIRSLLDLLRPRPGLRRWLLIGPVGLWLLLFQAIPLTLILIMSLGKRTELGGVQYAFNLDNYLRFFDPLYLRILLDSFGVALLVTVITLLVGYPLAYHIAVQPPRTRSFWLLLVILPFWTGMLIRTYGWIFILRGNGLINSLLQSLGFIEAPLALYHNMGAAVLGLVYILLPFMILPIYTSIEKFDFTLVRAAYDLGAGPVRTFLKVLWPLTLPGVAAGSVLVMVPSLGLFFVADLLGGAKTVFIGNLIHRQFTQARDWPFGAAASVILTLFTLSLVMLYLRSGGKEEDLV